MKREKNTSPGGVITSGSICASQRTPYCTVSLLLGCHLSWMNSDGSICGMSWVPACSTVRLPTPACCRNSSNGPTIVVPGGHDPVTLLVPLEHSTYFGPCRT